MSNQCGQIYDIVREAESILATISATKPNIDKKELLCQHNTSETKCVLIPRNIIRIMLRGIVYSKNFFMPPRAPFQFFIIKILKH